GFCSQRLPRRILPCRAADFSRWFRTTIEPMLRKFAWRWLTVLLLTGFCAAAQPPGPALQKAVSEAMADRSGTARSRGAARGLSGLQHQAVHAYGAARLRQTRSADGAALQAPGCHRRAQARLHSS